MSTAQPTHNRHLDAAREAYTAAIARRSVIDPHDLHNAAKIVDNAIDWLREAFRLVRERPDLSDYLERSAGTLKAMRLRLDQEDAMRGER